MTPTSLFVSLVFSFLIQAQTGNPKTAKPASAAPMPQASVAWKTLMKRCSGTATISGGKSFIAHDRSVSCLDGEGRTIWSTSIGPNDASLRVDSKRVYAGTLAGILFALDRKSGKILWRVQTQNAIHTAPSLQGSAVYASSCDGTVYAIEAASGTVLWKFLQPDGSLGYADPLPVGDTALFSCGETTLYRLDPLSGSLVWKAPLPGKGLATPARIDGKLVVAGDGCGLTALSEDDGKRVWRFPASGKSTDWYGVPLARDGIVYVGTVRGLVYAIDAATGRRIWASALDGEALARPSLDSARGTLWVTLTGVPRGGPSLVALDMRTGKKRFEHQLGDIAASPAIVGDRLFIGTLGGYYYAFSLN